MSLQKAKLELAEFLFDHPEMQEFQYKIDKELLGLTQEQRLLTINAMIAEKLFELTIEIKRLQDLANDIP